MGETGLSVTWNGKKGSPGGVKRIGKKGLVDERSRASHLEGGVERIVQAGPPGL